MAIGIAERRAKCKDKLYNVVMLPEHYQVITEALSLFEDTQQKKLQATYDALLHLLGNHNNKIFSGNCLDSAEVGTLFATLSNVLDDSDYMSARKVTYKRSSLVPHPVTSQVLHEELHHLERALDYYSRLGCTQLKELKNAWPGWDKLTPEEVDVAEYFIEQIRETAWGLKHGASLPIADGPAKARLAYEIQKVVQNMLATVETHSRPSIWHDAPLKITEVPLIEVTEL